VNRIETGLSRKNWDKKEIELIKTLRKDGKKFKDIGKTLGLSANAVRKALYRFSPEHQKIGVYVEKFSQYVSLHNAIEWGLKEGILNDYLNKDFSKVKKETMRDMTKTKLLILINKARIKKQLPIFFVKHFSE